MAGILTLSAIWNGFKTPKSFNNTLLKEEIIEKFNISHNRLSGRKTSKGGVKIYYTTVKKKNVKIAPVVIIAQDFGCATDLTLAYKLASKGYICITVDLEGQKEGKDFYTEYPEDVSYANYDEELASKTSTEDATKTCWYEWACALKYVYKFARETYAESKIGFFGINDGATTVIHTIATEENVSCAVLVGGSGWRAYKGIEKYGDTPEPHFNDDIFKFIAGIDAQTYSNKIKAPTLMLSATNSYRFDADRAYDTISRIEEDVYTAFNLSVNHRNVVDFASFNDAEIFLGKFLLEKEVNLPKEIIVKCEFEDGKCCIEVTPDEEDIKNLEIYVAEEIVSPSVRSWKRKTDVEEKNGNTYSFTYAPYYKSGKVFVFAKAYYKNRFVISSMIVCKSFGEQEVLPKTKGVIVYSSRIKEGNTAFAPLKENLTKPYGIRIEDGGLVEEKEAFNDISGVTCKDGLITYRVGALKYQPSEDSIFMFDACADKEGKLRVGLLSYKNDVVIEYFTTIKIVGNTWQNVKLSVKSFKTKDGAPIRDFGGINAISFDVEDETTEFFINNALWV